VVEPQTPALTPRGATWLILQREDKRDEGAPQLIAKLRGQHAELAEAIELTQDFVDLVRQRQGEELKSWLERATLSCLGPFQRLADSL
jgi:hypothetical protein